MVTKSSSIQVPPGFRESPVRALAHGEVVASTYSIRDEIARTDTGVVYEARDLLLDRPVAIKLAWRDPGTPSLVAEARRCSAVRDPCAVALYGMGNHHGLEYAVAERVTGQLLRELVGPQLATERYLALFRSITLAVARAHEAGIAIGELSGSTILVDESGRVILGRLSLSQVPAVGAGAHCLAPEVVRGEARADDPAAAESIDLYGLGCVAIELGGGVTPFAHHERERELHGHAYDPPPRLADLRPDLPAELSDLVDWTLAKRPTERPASAADVLAQLDALLERLGTKSRTLRVLVVDDDTARARWLWSLARRAHASAAVEIASEGTDAAHKLNRDLPDLVFVDSTLRGVMNALELCMYARGLENGERSATRAQLVLVGHVPERERLLFAEVGVQAIADDERLGSVVLEQVRQIAAVSPRRFKKRSTITG